MEHEKKQDKRLIGHKHTEKTKEKIRQANIGHVVTKETREKLSKWRTGKKFKPHTEETKRKMSISAKKIGYHNSENGIKKVRLAQLKRMKENHPKGMLGKKHDNIAKQKMSEASKERWKNPNSKFNSKEFRENLSKRLYSYHKNKILNARNMYSNCKRGYYDINGKKMYFRSSWEANYALYIDYLKNKKEILKWEYEIDTFWFEKIKRGVRSYTPDFKITNNDNTIEYHEVKGRMDSKSKTKLKRMKIYYPKIKMVLIDENVYNSIMKWKKLFILI